MIGSIYPPTPLQLYILFLITVRFGIWSLLSLSQTSMNVTWATGCAGTANVSTWSAATSVPVTRDTNPQRTDWSVLVSPEHLSDCFLSDVLFLFLLKQPEGEVEEVFRHWAVCFSASQTSTSVPLRTVAVRLSAPTQREAMSAAATVDTPWCQTSEAAPVRSFIFSLPFCHSVLMSILSCVSYYVLHSRQDVKMWWLRKNCLSIIRWS